MNVFVVYKVLTKKIASEILGRYMNILPVIGDFIPSLHIDCSINHGDRKHDFS